jgi:hypothetical protein
MSRSEPTNQALPNPSTRWLTFNGSTGRVRYFDKALEETVVLDYPLMFILLDVLCSVRGYDEVSECDIYSNEIRSVNNDVLTVTSRKGGKIATGLYAEIKTAVNSAGGDFHQNLYIAYKDGNELKIGSLRFKGAAVAAWMAFEKKHRDQIYEQAIVIGGSDDHAKGNIKFKTPKFSLAPLSPETQAAAKLLDGELQKYLRSVLAVKVGADTLAPAIDPAPPASDDVFDDVPF